MPKPFWKFQNVAGGRAELLLYGDISDSTWWGDEVTPKQFAEDLDKLGAVSEITVRINSGGGDVFAAQTIGNLLEQHPANVVARIDGLCASSATIVACHCDRVVAANDSTYMVHPVRLGLLGYYDATTLSLIHIFTKIIEYEQAPEDELYLNSVLDMPVSYTHLPANRRQRRPERGGEHDHAEHRRIACTAGPGGRTAPALDTR